MRAMSRRPSYRVAGAVAAGLCAVGLSACSSSSKPSSTNTTAPTTVVPTTPRSTSSTTVSSTARADTLCTDIKSSITAASSIDLSSPSSIESHASTVAEDLGKLNSDVSNSSYAPSGSPVQTMVQDVKSAIAQGEAAASQVAKGNIGNAKNDFEQMKTDLGNARSAGAKANLSSCT